MKDLIQSQLRHLFTGLSGVVVALLTFLVSKGYLTTEQATEFTPLLAELIENAGAVIGSLAAVVFSRIIITLLGKTKLGRSVANKFDLIILCTVTAVGLGLGLPSCAVANKAVDVIKKLDVRYTVDGCLLVGKTAASGQRYYGGVCVDGRLVIRWDQLQLDGSLTEIRYTRFPDGKTDVAYRSGKFFLNWDDKSGVTIGQVPVSSPEQLAIMQSKSGLPLRGIDHGPPMVSREAGIIPQK